MHYIHHVKRNDDVYGNRLLIILVMVWMEPHHYRNYIMTLGMTSVRLHNVTAGASQKNHPGTCFHFRVGVGLVRKV